MGQGRQRVTTKEYLARLTSELVRGIVVPPKCGFSTPQPFLIEGAMTVSGGSGPVMVHERMSDGTVSSNRVDLLKTD